MSCGKRCAGTARNLHGRPGVSSSRSKARLDVWRRIRPRIRSFDQVSITCESRSFRSCSSTKSVRRKTYTLLRSLTQAVARAIGSPGRNEQPVATRNASTGRSRGPGGITIPTTGVGPRARSAKPDRASRSSCIRRDPPFLRKHLLPPSASLLIHRSAASVAPPLRRGGRRRRGKLNMRRAGGCRGEVGHQRAHVAGMKHALRKGLRASHPMEAAA